MGVEVVAVEQQHVTHPVGGVGDLDLDLGHPAYEVAPQPVLLARAVPGRTGVDAIGDPQAHDLLQLADHRVVIVVAGKEHHAPAAQLCRDEVDESLSLGHGVLDRREQEVEQVAEQDQLVDVVEVGRESRQRVGVRQQVVARPRPEVRVGDRQGAHAGAGYIETIAQLIRASATPIHTAIRPRPMPIDVGTAPKCV